MIGTCRDMTYELNSRVVLITGAANGIGAAVVRELLVENIKHVAILDIDVKMGTKLQNELNVKYGGEKVKLYYCDVTNEDQLFGAFKSVIDSYGYIDLVINNAGICNDNLPFYKKEIAINVTALITSTMKALELMREDQGGRGGTIINVASIAAMAIVPALSIYCATKAAVLHFSNCLGDEEYYSITKVRVLTMCLGITDTSIFCNAGTFDKCLEDKFSYLLGVPRQSCKSAAMAFVEAYKRGGTGSVWLSSNDEPAKDITDSINKQSLI